MARRLVDLWDPNLDVPDISESEVIARVTASNRERLLVCLAVTQFKRRLGARSDAELARDKRVSRIAGNAFANVLMQAEGNARTWNQMWSEYREEACDNLAARQAAAVIKWSEWLPTQAHAVSAEVKWCASWVMRINTASQLVRAVARQLDTCVAHLLRLAEQC